MLKFFVRNSWWIVSIITLALLIIHTFQVGNFTIDNVSLVLLVLLLISPFISQIRKIKVGDFEAEIDPKEIQKVKDDMDSKLMDEINSEHVPEVQETIKNITELLETDHILALAKLRIELEKTITKLYRLFMGHKKQSDKHVSFGKIVHELNLREVLPKDISGPLKEILYFCNRAVHGDEVKLKDAKKIVDIGISIYKHVNFLGQDYITKPVETLSINAGEINEYQNMQYKVVTITPYLENPQKNIRIVNQDGLDELLDGYGEYAEFIIEIRPIE